MKTKILAKVKYIELFGCLLIALCVQITGARAASSWTEITQAGIDYQQDNPDSAWATVQTKSYTVPAGTVVTGVRVSGEADNAGYCYAYWGTGNVATYRDDGTYGPFSVNGVIYPQFTNIAPTCSYGQCCCGSNGWQSCIPPGPTGNCGQSVTPCPSPSFDDNGNAALCQSSIATNGALTAQSKTGISLAAGTVINLQGRHVIGTGSDFIKCKLEIQTDAITNGSCGFMNGQYATSAPTGNFCNGSGGSFSGFTGTNPWTWSCFGANGGSTATCATRTSPIACGPQCSSAVSYATETFNSSTTDCSSPLGAKQYTMSCACGDKGFDPNGYGYFCANPIVTLSATPTSINKGSSTTLNWTLKNTNATSCAASGSSEFSAVLPASGSQSVSPTSDTTFAVNCSNYFGSASASALVNVNCRNDFNYSCQQISTGKTCQSEGCGKIATKSTGICVATPTNPTDPSICTAPQNLTQADCESKGVICQNQTETCEACRTAGNWTEVAP